MLMMFLVTKLLYDLLYYFKLTSQQSFYSLDDLNVLNNVLHHVCRTIKLKILVTAEPNGLNSSGKIAEYIA